MTRVHVYELLRRGSLKGEPDPDGESEFHKVRVQGSLAEFGRLEIVLKIRYVGQSICITVYGISGQEVRNVSS